MRACESRQLDGRSLHTAKCLILSLSLQLSLLILFVLLPRHASFLFTAARNPWTDLAICNLATVSLHLSFSHTHNNTSISMPRTRRTAKRERSDPRSSIENDAVDRIARKHQFRIFSFENRSVSDYLSEKLDALVIAWRTTDGEGEDGEINSLTILRRKTRLLSSLWKDPVLVHEWKEEFRQWTLDLLREVLEHPNTKAPVTGIKRQKTSSVPQPQGGVYGTGVTGSTGVHNGAPMPAGMQGNSAARPGVARAVPSTTALHDDLAEVLYVSSRKLKSPKREEGSEKSPGDSGMEHT